MVDASSVRHHVLLGGVLDVREASQLRTPRRLLACLPSLMVMLSERQRLNHGFHRLLRVHVLHCRTFLHGTQSTSCYVRTEALHAQIAACLQSH